MLVLGLISGTSLDAIDAALVDIQTEPELSVRLQSFSSVPYPAELRRALLASLPPLGGSVRDVCALNFAVGEAFAAAAIDAASRAGLDLRSIDLIGSHGQTLLHLMRPEDGHATHCTLQIGEAAVIAERTGITCVADFRVADVAAGGQGAPLVPYIDHALLRSCSETRVALNVGGIANVTILPKAARLADVRAFDTGPGNMLIDECARRATDGRCDYDAEGRIASRGKVRAELLLWTLSHPYYSLAAPKSTGREEFGAQYAAEIWRRGQALGCAPEDIVATVTALTAHTIAAAIPPDTAKIIVTGGGAHNRTLIEMLKEALHRGESKTDVPPVELGDAYGLDVDAKEAMAFALLAFATLRGMPNNLPSCTGARRPVVLGKIVPGRNLFSLSGRLFADAPSVEPAR